MVGLAMKRRRIAISGESLAWRNERLGDDDLAGCEHGAAGGDDRNVGDAEGGLCDSDENLNEKPILNDREYRPLPCHISVDISDKKRTMFRRVIIVAKPAFVLVLFTFIGCFISMIWSEKFSSAIFGYAIFSTHGWQSKDSITGAPRPFIKMKQRRNMEECYPHYGKIMIFIGVEETSYKRFYNVSLDSIRCYVKSTPYTLKIVDVFKDIRVEKFCKQKSVYFRRHCAAAVYLEDTDYMLVVDADTGVVNPDHCIEEYIDPRVDMVFYERFFNWEIASGTYLVKNTHFSKNFMLEWANYEYFNYQELGWWKGFDNGVLHIVFMESLFAKDSQEVKNCHEYWKRSTGYETYLPYVMCVRIYIGGARIWPGKLKLLRRAHAFTRDWYPTRGYWWSNDFFIHGWKFSSVSDGKQNSPFTEDFDLKKCGRNYAGWSWREDRKTDVKTIHSMLQAAERRFAKAVLRKNLTIPFISEPDIGQCFPKCDSDD